MMAAVLGLVACLAAPRVQYQAGVEAFHRGDLARAEERLRQAARADPRSAESHTYLVLPRLGRGEEGTLQLRQAAWLAPREARVLARRSLGVRARAGPRGHAGSVRPRPQDGAVLAPTVGA